MNGIRFKMQKPKRSVHPPSKTPRMRGDGAMPSIALSGPTVFGDQGGQRPGCMLKDWWSGHMTETPPTRIMGSDNASGEPLERKLVVIQTSRKRM